MGKINVQSFLGTAALGCLLLFGGASACLGALPVVHHDLVVTLYPEAQRLTGTDTVTLAPRGAAHMAFALAPGARIINVSMDEKAIPFTFEDG